MKLSRRRSAAVLSAGCVAAVTTIASLLVGSPAGAVASGCVYPPDYAHTIPTRIAGPAAAPSAGNSVYYATVGGDRKTYVVETDIEQSSGLLVDRLECLGGGAVDTPAVVPYTLGKALYVLAPTGVVYESYAPKGGDRTAWTRVPGAPVGGGAPVVTTSSSGPVVTAGASGSTIQMFVRGPNNQLYHASRDSAAGGRWSVWEPLGGGLTGVAAAGAGTADGRIAVVVRAPNGTLYQKTGRTGAWSGWTKLAGTTSASPTIATGFAPGRLDLFVTGTSGGLYQATWPAGGPGFGAFKKVTPALPAGAKLAAAGKGGRMIVYATARFGPTTAVGYVHYVPRAGWSTIVQAPYTCAKCVPAVTVAGTGRRAVPAEPVG
jgi:hypothetical protein